MQLGMIGLGRMGANIVRRLMRNKHSCVVYDVNRDSIHALEQEGASGTNTLSELFEGLSKPRAAWIMVPAGLVDNVINEVVNFMEQGDIIIDGGNSHYREDIRRAQELAAKGIHYVDIGVSGGVWGLERGYCQMIGGEEDIVAHLDPIFRSLAPGSNSAPQTPGREEGHNTAEQGYLHCGPHGAGHFVKMIHNGIEYGLMAAYAEGLQILNKANFGRHQPESTDAETTPLHHAEHYAYDFNLADITELWRRGSVISSWLLDLTAQALLHDPKLTQFSGHVSDSGEGRWTVQTAVDAAVPAHVLSAALYQRFSSRGEADFADRVLSAMRFAFGGHLEQSKE